MSQQRAPPIPFGLLMDAIIKPNTPEWATFMMAAWNKYVHAKVQKAPEYVNWVQELVGLEAYCTIRKKYCATPSDYNKAPANSDAEYVKYNEQVYTKIIGQGKPHPPICNLGGPIITALDKKKAAGWKKKDGKFYSVREIWHKAYYNMLHQSLYNAWIMWREDRAGGYMAAATAARAKLDHDLKQEVAACLKKIGFEYCNLWDANAKIARDCSLQGPQIEQVKDILKSAGIMVHDGPHPGVPDPCGDSSAARFRNKFGHDAHTGNEYGDYYGGYYDDDDLYQYDGFGVPSHGHHYGNKHGHKYNEYLIDYDHDNYLYNNEGSGYDISTIMGALAAVSMILICFGICLCIACAAGCIASYLYKQSQSNINKKKRDYHQPPNLDSNSDV